MLAKCQTEPGATKLAGERIIDLLEQVENPGLIRFGDTDAAQDRLRQLHHDLRGHPWGSVHDAYSGRVRTYPPAINGAMSLAFERSTNGVVHAGRTFTHSEWAQHLLAQIGAEGEWLDHLTADVLPPQTPGRMIPWAFKKNHWHWLQAGWVKNAN